MTTCYDLRSRGYRVHNETFGRPAHERDSAWDLVIPGKCGFVAPFGRLPPNGSGLLVACTRSIGMTRRILANVPGAKVVQDGSDGQNVTFAPEHLDAVAKLLYLYRPRVLTGEQRAALIACGAATRFTTGVAHAEGSSNGGKADQVTVGPSEG
jgi:hypothetical protein